MGFVDAPNKDSDKTDFLLKILDFQQTCFRKNFAFSLYITWDRGMLCGIDNSDNSKNWIFLELFLEFQIFTSQP